MAVARNTIFLCYDKEAEAAARFYAETFPDSAVHAVYRAPSDYSLGKAGDTEDFARIHRKYLSRLPGVRQMQTSFSIGTVVKTTALAV